MKHNIKPLLAIMILMLVCKADGQQWSTEINLTNSAGGSFLTNNSGHSLAVQGQTIYLAWFDFYERTNMGCQIRFKKYDGYSWSVDTTVGFIGNKNLNNWYPDCVVDAGGTFHLVWETNEFTTDIQNFEIAYRNYKSGVWGGIFRVTTSAGQSSNPVLACSPSGSGYVFWQENDNDVCQIKYKTFSGSSWGSESNIRINTDYCGLPSAAICQNLPVVVWEDFTDGTFQIHCRKMGASGWGQDSAISHSQLGAFSPSIASDDEGNLHVVWQDWSIVSSRICYRGFSITSGTWDTEAIISTDGNSKENPVVICRDSSVDVFWSDDRTGYYEIYHRSLANGTWGAEEKITDQGCSAIMPGAVADSRGNMHLAWAGNPSINNTSPDIFLKSLYVDPWPSFKDDLSNQLPPVCEVSAYPNPTSGRVMIKFGILSRNSSESYKSRVDIYNIAGQLVNSLFVGSLPSGEQTLEWEGRNATGEAVPNGIYFARLTAGAATTVAKIMVVR